MKEAGRNERQIRVELGWERHNATHGHRKAMRTSMTQIAAMVKGGSARSLNNRPRDRKDCPDLGVGMLVGLIGFGA